MTPGVYTDQDGDMGFGLGLELLCDSYSNRIDNFAHLLGDIGRHNRPTLDIYHCQELLLPIEFLLNKGDVDENLSY